MYVYEQYMDWRAKGGKAKPFFERAWKLLKARGIRSKDPHKVRQSMRVYTLYLCIHTLTYITRNVHAPASHLCTRVDV